jgi:hypothetical protein
VRGLRVAGHPLTIDVDATGKVAVDTTARLTVESTALNVEGGVS